MPHIYATNWEWVTGSDAETSWAFWNVPQATNAMRWIDCRTLAGKAQRGGPGGPMIAVYDRQVTLPGAIYLGDDPTAKMDARLVDGWRTFFGIAEPLEGVSVSDVLWNTMTIHAQASGVDRLKGLLPSRQGIISLHLPMFGAPRRKRIDPDATEWSRVVTIYQEDYRANRARNLALYTEGDPRRTKHLGTLTYLCEKFGLDPDAEYRRFIPADLPDEGRLDHESSFTDDFNGAGVATDIDAWGVSGTATGWSYVAGSGTAIQVETAGYASNSGVKAAARITDDLGQDEQYAQASCYNGISGTGEDARYAGVCVQMSSSADTYYRLGMTRTDDTPTLDFYLGQVSAGTYSNLASDTGITGESSTANQMRIEFDGSDLTCYSNNYATSRFGGPVTDGTPFSGNNFAGIAADHTGDDRIRHDDVEVGTLATGITVPEMMAARQVSGLQPMLGAIRVIPY